MNRIEIRQGMEVYGADNQLLGTLDRLNDSDFEVGGRRIVRSSVARVDGNRIYLSGASNGFSETARTEGSIHVPVHEEQLNVEKRSGQIGEVEVRKTVTEEQQRIPVELSREEVHVEQRDVADRPAGRDEGAFQEGTIRVPIRGEEAVVTKDVVVTGDVVVDKTRTTERQEITDTVRKEHVEVDQNATRNQTPVRSGSMAAGAATGARPRRDLSGRKTVAALFSDRADAERAINDLKSMGFTGDQIGVAMRDRSAQGELVEDTGSHAAEGAVSGAVGGGLLGGIVGFLAGVGALAIPGVGPVIAGGILASTLTGAGIGAAVGGLAGALIGMGIPEEEAKHFEKGFREGNTLVTVNAGNRANEAVEVLERNGGDTGAAVTRA